MDRLHQETLEVRGQIAEKQRSKKSGMLFTRERNREEIKDVTAKRRKQQEECSRKMLHDLSVSCIAHLSQPCKLEQARRDGVLRDIVIV